MLVRERMHSRYAMCDSTTGLQSGDIRLSQEARRHDMHLRAYPFVHH